MIAYVLRRLALLTISMILAIMVLFVLLRLLPGDPASTLISIGAGQEQIEAAREQLGTDLPIGQQFVHFAGQLARLDLGTSFVSRRPVGAEIAARLSVTAPLTLLAFTLAILIAVPLGIVAAVKADRWTGAALSAVSQFGIALPVFWVGIIFVTVFAVHFRLLPSGGFPAAGWSEPIAVLRSFVLPVSTIAVVIASILVRYVRSATLDVIGSDYIRTARALGATFSQALLRHGVRNGSVPVISILGIELATTFIGAVVVEQVFTLPGLGSLLLTAIQQRDYPTVQGVLLVSTFLVLLVGFVADFVQRIVDPRLRERVANSSVREAP